MRTIFGTSLALVAALLLAFLPAPETGRADPLDFDIPGGHFFQQTNGANGAGNSGFAVIDDAQARFWSEFQRLGGVSGVGYPVSQRFIWDGFPSQAFQKMVFQWHANEGRVYAVNVVDVLHDRGRDAWLRTVRATPGIQDWSSDAGKPWEQVVAAHRALLTDPDIQAKYLAVDDPITLYGLPMAPIQNMGNVLVLRTQRGILQKWLIDVPWAKAGQVTVANSGDVAKEAGLLPSTAVALQPWLANTDTPPASPVPASPLVVNTPTPTPTPTLLTPEDVAPRPLNLAPLRPAPRRTDGRSWRVVLDPGHGGSEIGASHTFANGLVVREKDLNLRIALRTAQLLQGVGIAVRVTRDSDRKVNEPPVDLNGDGQASLADDLQARAAIANQFGADLFISIHNNGLSDSSASGTEVYYDPDRPFSAINQTLAQFLDQRIVQFIQLAGYPVRNRGVKTDSSVTRGGHFAVLGPQSDSIPNPSRMPAALTESLFVSSDFDAPWLARPEIQEAIARGHAEGIIDYLDWRQRQGG